jgi:hypothetical protein
MNKKPNKPPEGYIGDKPPIVVPGIVTYLNSMLDPRYKIKPDSKHWESLCNQPFTFTTPDGKIYTIETPEELFDKDETFKQWTKDKVAVACKKYNERSLKTRAAMVALVTAGDSAYKPYHTYRPTIETGPQAQGSPAWAEEYWSDK